MTAGDKDPHIQELYRQYNILATEHNNLVGHCNSNFKIYQDSIHQLDVRLGAAYLVIQDLLDGAAALGQSTKDGNPTFHNVHTTTVVAEGVSSVRVDWPHYMMQHLEVVKAEVEKLQAQKRAIDDKLTEEQGSPLITPPGAGDDTNLDDAEDADEPVEFGGDHVKNQQQSAPA